MVKKLICIFVSILFATGCSITFDFTQPKIIPPENLSNPLYGVWVIKQDIGHESQGITDDELIGKKIEFSQEHLLFEDSILKYPTYQIKRVDLNEFILYNQRDLLLDFIKTKQVEVVTILDGDLFFAEVFLLDTDEIILSISRNVYLLERTHDDFTVNLDDKKKHINSALETAPNHQATPTALLLGLKSHSPDTYNYRTLWISNIDNNIEFIEMEDILFPRRSGFWNLKIIDDQIFAISTSTDKASSMAPFQLQNPKKEIVIDYVGNDYISLEEKYVETGEYYSTRKIVPVDSLPKTSGVSMGDLIGTHGESAFKNSKEMALAKMEQSLDDVIFVPTENNFGLIRNMGQWILVGNLSYQQDNSYFTETYKINILPPEELVKYDLFHLSWAHIKDHIPTATDAFTSPAKNMAVIITPTEILVYGIDNNNLSQEPLAVTKINREETVIMAEWATGIYVNSWYNEVKQQVQ